MEKAVIPENMRGKRWKGNPAYNGMNAQIDKTKKSGDKRKFHIAIQTILRISGIRLYGTIPDNLPV